MGHTRNEWRRLLSDVAAYRAQRRRERALALILRAEKLDPNVLGDIVAASIQIAAERVAETQPDALGRVRVEVVRPHLGPWGKRSA